MLLNENRIFIIIREIILYATYIVFGIPGIHIIKNFYNHGTAKLSKMTHQNNALPPYLLTEQTSKRQLPNNPKT